MPISQPGPSTREGVSEGEPPPALRGLRLDGSPERLQAMLSERLGDQERTPRLMQVVHTYRSSGGTEHHTRELVAASRDTWAVAVVYPDRVEPGSDLALGLAGGMAEVVLGRNLIGTRRLIRHAPAELRSPGVERAFAAVLSAFRPDVVHFQHLLGFGSLALPVLAHKLGARVVISLHDYFLLCPDWNLLGPHGRDCGHSDATACGQAAACLGAKQIVAEGCRPQGLDTYVAERKRAVAVALSAADAVVAPSAFVKDKFAAALGDAVAGNIQVIPPGMRPFPAPAPAPASAESGEPTGARRPTRSGHGKRRRRRPATPARDVRVAFLGNFRAEKGARVFLEAAARLARDPVQLEVYGAANVERPPRNVKFHGRYARPDLPRLLTGVEAVVVPSIVHETYCHAVDEALSLGIPVIAARAGALGERVEHGRTGLLFPLGDSAALAEAIRGFCRDEPLRSRLRTNVQRLTPRTHADTMRAYRALYQRLLR